MISVPIRYRRAELARFIQQLQHAVPSIVVLGNGIQHLSHEPHGAALALGVAEVVASVLVIGSVIRGLRQLPRSTAHADHSHAHGVDWIDIFLGVMLGVEAYAHYRTTADVPRPTILLAAAMFALGVFHGRIAAKGDERRTLRVSADGISLPGRLFSRLTLAWHEVATIDVDDARAVVTAIDGRTKTIDFSDTLQPSVVRDALMSARTLLDDARHAASASLESAATDASHRHA